MTKINENYLKLKGSYLFAEVARRAEVSAAQHPDRELIRLGIGDVTKPLAPAVVSALHSAVDEMGKAETFRGYGPYEGYAFLRDLICEHDYQSRHIPVEADEIFVSDGAKSDCGNIGDILGTDNVVAVCDPVYPVYVDTNVMAGRAGDMDENGQWGQLIYMPCLKENNFTPLIPPKCADIIYLCFPNNPTGAIATKKELTAWVEYAKKNDSLILYDSAYEAFITDPDIPRSIFEIPGARECAIEFRSFSKTAGFTGLRCAYTIIPKDLKRGGASLHDLWFRRQSTKYNGVPYIVQRAAAAVYSKEGGAQIQDTISYYHNNAKIIREGLQKAGLSVSGGINAPYIWLETPDGINSWEFFDLLMERAGVVTTPGAGFGPSGEGYIRLTAFGETSAAQRAVERISKAF
ncbi:MAG: LL-diaminopimelate aminotransferase [Oscillospiraceae bacterium]|nr:LL-diaminopimelate aminotransferase [Oscillospiraceae bacterium]